MPRRYRLVPLVACLALLAGTSGQAQTPGAPGAGPLSGRVYVPDRDGICAEGAALDEGCDTIRARQIADASRPPWRAIGRVNYASTRIRGHCTGTLVGESVVVTAAHCLYNRARKSWIPARSILFAAGYQRGRFEAMSRVARYVLDPVQDPTSRVFAGDPSQDWALLVLEDPIGADAGFVGLGSVTPQTLWTAELVFAGYPALRPHVLSVERDCGGADLAPGDRLLLQQCAVMPGDSGGPVFAVEGDDLRLVAVLSGVVRDGDTLASASASVAVIADALRQQLGAEAVPAEIAARPAAEAAGAAPAPVAPEAPAPPPAPDATYPPPPATGR